MSLDEFFTCTTGEHVYRKDYIDDEYVQPTCQGCAETDSYFASYTELPAFQRWVDSMTTREAPSGEIK